MTLLDFPKLCRFLPSKKKTQRKGRSRGLVNGEKSGSEGRTITGKKEGKKKARSMKVGEG